MSLEMFVSADDTFTVNLAVGADKNKPKTIYADVSIEKLKEVYGEDLDEATIEEHSVVFRRPNFNDLSKLYDDAISWDGVEVKANPSSVRMNKMIRLLKSWTLPRPATAQEIRQLNPILALVIGSELDRLSP